MESERQAIWKLLDERKENPMLSEMETHMSAMEARLEQVMFREVRRQIDFVDQDIREAEQRSQQMILDEVAKAAKSMRPVVVESSDGAPPSALLVYSLFF